MSVRVMAWVWAQSESTATARFVLLAIADAANDAGAEAYPSMSTLTKKTRLSERTVQSAIRTLESIGELVVYRNAGPKGSNKYRIVMRQTPAESAPPQNLHPAINAGADLAPPQNPAPNPAVPAPQPPQQLHPNHPLTTQEPKKTSERSSNGTRIPDDFAVTDDMIAWARRHTPLVGTVETEAFVDYWRSRPGAGSRKTDWVATWRNWMRRSQQEAERRPARASPNGLVEHNGMKIRPETAERLAGRARMVAIDEAEEAKKAIGQ